MFLVFAGGLQPATRWRRFATDLVRGRVNAAFDKAGRRKDRVSQEENTQG